MTTHEVDDQHGDDKSNDCDDLQEGKVELKFTCNTCSVFCSRADTKKLTEVLHSGQIDGDHTQKHDSNVNGQMVRVLVCRNLSADESSQARHHMLTPVANDNRSCDNFHRSGDDS